VQYRRVIGELEPAPELQGHDLTKVWRDADDRWRAATGAEAAVNLDFTDEETLALLNLLTEADRYPFSSRSGRRSR
jgi:hypothetical protein